MKLNKDRVRDVLENADRYHAAFHAADTFSGPSLYFHQRALSTRNDPTSLQHFEYVYATLASWDRFRGSVEKLKDRIVNAQHFTPMPMNEEGWAVLKDIFTGLKIMASRTLLVGNSKVMHHMMPNIVPPIDREYTLRYLCGNTMFQNDPEKEWQTMRSLISGFFIPVAIDNTFAAKATQWIADKRPWDTSLMKVIDNILIGARKPGAKPSPGGK